MSYNNRDSNRNSGASSRVFRRNERPTNDDFSTENRDRNRGQFAKNENNAYDDQDKVKLVIGSAFVGRIIGPAGKTINELQRKYNVRININREPNSDGSKDCEVTGSNPNVRDAVKEINEKIDKPYERRDRNNDNNGWRNKPAEETMDFQQSSAPVVQQIADGWEDQPFVPTNDWKEEEQAQSQAIFAESKHNYDRANDRQYEKKPRIYENRSNRDSKSSYNFNAQPDIATDDDHYGEPIDWDKVNKDCVSTLFCQK